LKGGAVARREDFTDEEWSQLQNGVVGAALLVSVSDRGFFETFKESGAAGRHLAEARRENPSDLVRELAEAPAMGFGFGTNPQELETGRSKPSDAPLRRFGRSPPTTLPPTSSSSKTSLVRSPPPPKTSAPPRRRRSTRSGRRLRPPNQRMVG
jgi:hypothetical protein